MIAYIKLYYILLYYIIKMWEFPDFLFAENVSTHSKRAVTISLSFEVVNSIP
jgi:hypothetical protein